MAGGSEALFQVAIGVIPGLFFGGALIERRTDLAEQISGAGKTAVGIFVVAGVIAQVIAIRGAIDPTVSGFEQRFVIGVLVAGTVAIALVTAISWVLPSRTAASRPVIAAAAAVFVAGSLAAQLAVTDSLEDAGARMAWDRAFDRIVESDRRRSDADEELRNASEQLIEAARSTAGHVRARVIPITTRYLAAMREADPVHDLDELEGAQIDRALQRANRRAARAADEFEVRLDRVPGIRRTDLALLELSSARLLSAHGQRAAALADHAVTRRRFDDACREAERVGCVRRR